MINLYYFLTKSTVMSALLATGTFKWRIVYCYTSFPFTPVGRAAKETRPARCYLEYVSGRGGYA